MGTEREALFKIAEPESKPELVPFIATIPEISKLFSEPTLKLKLHGTLKQGKLLFEKGKEHLETNPTNWIELAKKYKLDDLVTAFEKELQQRGFPLKQGELLPEMKKVLRK